MNRLDEILRVKRDAIEKLRPRRGELHKGALLRNDFRGFAAALRQGQGKVALIAEIKKASPSAGVIAEHFDPVAIANNYARAGVDAISVLTDEPFFQGHLDHLRLIRDAVGQPLLRKDFILDPLQIMEAAAAGADAILLIVAALDQDQLVALLETAALYQLDVMVEVHTLPELDRALDTEATIIGVNNRDLRTFRTSLKTSECLIAEAPRDRIMISESGLQNSKSLRHLRALGFRGFLVGDALMRAPDPEAALRDFIAGAEDVKEPRQATMASDTDALQV